MNSTLTPAQLAMRQFYRRVLPDNFIDFSSDEGKCLFGEALTSGYMNCYFKLAAQFVTQDEPTYCGVSTLVMVLNSLAVDPGKVWKGVWRWYHESMLDCCVPLEVIQQKGITFGEFIRLANCNHLDTTVVRVDQDSDEHAFRDVIKTYTQRDDVIIVASYSRRLIHQTGDGHFTTIGGYHEVSDKVLILDVARFKYPPHWIDVPMLFEAMKGQDKETGLPRGYILMKRKPNANPLIIFKISLSVCLNATDEAMVSGLGLLTQWTKFLSQPMTDVDARNDHLFDFIVRNLLRVVLELKRPVTFFSTQISCECSEHLTDGCKCLISKTIRSLKRSAYYPRVVKVVSEFTAENAEVAEKLRAFGNASAFNCCRFCSSECFLAKEDFLLMFILSWPYRQKGETIERELRDLVDAHVDDGFDEVLRNEIDGLRNQFAVFLEISREGRSVSCPSGVCCVK